MTLAKIEIPSNVVHYEFKVDGDSNFKVTKFSYREALSDIGGLDIDLVNVNLSIDPGSLIDKKATLKIPCGTENSRSFKFYHGVVIRFEQTGTDLKAAFYRAHVVPRLWKLSLVRQSRVHVTDASQNQKLEDVVKKVLRENGLSGNSVSFQLSGQYTPYSFLTQYRESDLDFISRLCEEEGVTYFFEQKDGEEVVTFVDSNQPYQKCKPFDEVLVRSSKGALEDEFESIFRFHHIHQIGHGKVEMRDYDFKQSHRALKEDADARWDDKLEFYDYPGGFQDQEDPSARMKKLAKLRADEFNAPTKIASGEGNYRSLSAGHKFKTKDHPVSSLNREWLCVEVTHSGTELAHVAGDGQPLGFGGVTYTNSFFCMPSDVVHRPVRRTHKPFVHGSQTAVVVGPANEEIHTDKFGRIKVKLHWDRVHQRVDEASFWVRVSQSWAGRKWGTFFLPRVGQEVVVDFLEGNPDQPIVTGMVYNDYQRVPYLLPDHKTRSTIKTNSSPGGKGFNELRFEDKAGKEQIFIHAERNLDVRVKNDCMESIGHNHHLTVGSDYNGGTGDQKIKIFRDQLTFVKRNQDVVIGGDFKKSVGGPNGGNYELSVDGERHTIITKKEELSVGGDRNVSLNGNNSLIASNLYQSINANIGVEAGQEIHIKAGMNMILEAGIQLTLKVGGSFVVIDPTGVTIQGPLVKINSGGAAGSGAGCPAATTGGVTLATEADPTPADNDKPGEKSVW